MEHQEQVIINDFEQYNNNRVYYHVVLTTKYRHKIIKTGEMSDILEQTIFQIAQYKGWDIHKLQIQPDHIHVLLSTSPDVSPSMLTGEKAAIYEDFPPEIEIFNVLKRRTSRKLGEKFKWNRGAYIGSISKENILKKDPYKDFEYKYKASRRKAHILLFHYQCNRKKLEELIGQDNLIYVRGELENIVYRKNYITNKYPIFDKLEFDPKNKGNTAFFIRSIPTFPPNWILKSLFKRLIENPTDEQMKEWLNNWYISTQGIEFDIVQEYIDNHDDPQHDKKWSRYNQFIHNIDSKYAK